MPFLLTCLSTFPASSAGQAAPDAGAGGKGEHSSPRASAASASAALRPLHQTLHILCSTTVANGLCVVPVCWAQYHAVVVVTHPPVLGKGGKGGAKGGDKGGGKGKLGFGTILMVV